MPQFEFAEVFIPQLFWLSVFFVILYFGIVKTTLPRLGKVMDERENTIRADLDSAEEAKHAADRLDAEYRTRLDAGREEARAAVAKAKEEAGHASEERLAAADSTVDARMVEAEARIAAARAQAEQSLRDIVADSAQTIVVKLTGNQPSEAAVQAELDRVMAQEKAA